MPYQLWSQDNFSKGELSPYMYARAQVSQYFDSLKTAQNVLTYPTGAAGKRFGTLYQATLEDSATVSAQDLFFQTFQWYDIALYQLVFSPLLISIYLEGIKINEVVTTLDGQSVFNLSSTTLGGKFRVAGEGFMPFDLQNGADAGITFLSVNTDSITLSAAIDTALIYPVTFTTTGTLPTSSPQLKEDIFYFARNIGGNTVELYPTAHDAKFQENIITITAATGSGVNTMFTYNTWTFTNPFFKNLPIYDFDGGYDGITFTPTAVAGAAVTINLSGPLTAPATLDAKYEGGAFIGGGGTSRIITVVSPTQMTVATQLPFDGITAIEGSLAFLAEPAWSDERGWPEKCSSYQNRALFANTASLPNGFWGSVVNDYSDFGDLTTDDDDAISWFPSSNEVNVIRFIVPFRSLTVHTNSGIYSSPLSEIAAITPTTFTLQLQDSTPASVLQPQAIDNQIIVISGNDVHTMIWDGINNAYTSNIVSIVNEQTIRDPVDETAFADLARAGSRYVFIVNDNGSMAVYQTLFAENVSGFTLQIMEQSYGHAKFLQVASSFDGRCWFLVEREIAIEQTPIGISFAVPPTTLVPQTNITALGINLSLTEATAVVFSTMVELPTCEPELTDDRYYWAIGVDVDTFKVYLTKEDAEANANAIEFTDGGSSSEVTAWLKDTIFTIEELTQDVHLDCAVYYTGAAIDTVPTGDLFNAQDVKMVADSDGSSFGFGFEAVGFNDEVAFEAHGTPVDVTEAYIGFPINLVIEPMPLAVPSGSQTTLTKPTHIRSVRFMFNNTIGGEINGVPIALKPFSEVEIGEPPLPARGVFEMSIMKGWDDFNNPSFTITHSDPFNIELIGIFYSLEN